MQKIMQRFDTMGNRIWQSSPHFGNVCAGLRDFSLIQTMIPSGAASPELGGRGGSSRLHNNRNQVDANRYYQI